MSDIQKERHEFLDELYSLLFVHDIGEQVLLEVEKKLGFQPFYYNLLFPDGIKQIVSLMEEKLDNDMEKNFISQFEISKLRVREKILELVMLRLHGLTHKFLEFYSKPQYYPLAVKNSWSSVNKMWVLAGDESTDFNYYTKRSLLLSIYIPSLAYYTKDTSENFINTRNFVSRRIDQVMKIPKLKKVPEMFKNWLNNLVGG